MTERMNRLAGRVEADGFFLASALGVYASSEGLDRRTLAERLGCDAATLDRVCLCQRPRATSFLPDVKAIAERFGLHEDALAVAVRHADALDALGRAAGMRGTLMAARDREE